MVKRYTTELKEYADLRNAIVHERTDEHIIADPRPEVVKKIIELADLITSPKKVYPELTGAVASYTPDASISEVVMKMQRQSYSQVPVVKENGVVIGLLTMETFARWLADKVKDDCLSLSETKLSEVLKCADKDPNHIFISRDEPLLGVLDKFEGEMNKGHRLDAILITQTGKKGESLLGIVTVWDIPKILRLTKVE